jgi:hypothetical protein
MTSERWRQIESLYHAALERAPEKRAAYLAAACHGDDELQARPWQELLMEPVHAMSAFEVAEVAAFPAKWDVNVDSQWCVVPWWAVQGPHGPGLPLQGSRTNMAGSWK